MLEKHLDIFLGASEIVVAKLIYSKQDNREFSRVEYTPEWLELDSAFAISPEFPLGSAPEFRRRDRERQNSCFLSAIADTGPDSWGRGLVRRTNPGATEYDFLTEVNDVGRQGALRFRNPGDDTWLSSEEPDVPRLSTLSELRKSIHQIERDPGHIEEHQKGIFGSGRGGARPKSDVMDDQGMLYIAKYPSVNDTKPVERAEVATLAVASKVGLNAASAFLEGQQYAVAVIQRFDRTSSGTRHMYISGQTMLQADEAIGHFYTDLLDHMRGQSENFGEDAKELFARIAYTILISNHDDHMKNHGFLKTSGASRWELSPMFDVNPQPDRQNFLETGISPLSGNEASIEALLEVAGEFGLDAKEAALHIGGMAELISSLWEPSLAATGMSAPERRFYKKAIEHAEFTKALKLV